VGRGRRFGAGGVAGRLPTAADADCNLSDTRGAVIAPLATTCIPDRTYGRSEPARPHLGGRRERSELARERSERSRRGASQCGCEAMWCARSAHTETPRRALGCSRPPASTPARLGDGQARRPTALTVSSPGGGTPGEGSPQFRSARAPASAMNGVEPGIKIPFAEKRRSDDQLPLPTSTSKLDRGHASVTRTPVKDARGFRDAARATPPAGPGPPGAHRHDRFVRLPMPRIGHPTVPST